MDFNVLISLSASVIPGLTAEALKRQNQESERGGDSSTRKPGGNKTQMPMVFR